MKVYFLYFFDNFATKKMSLVAHLTLKVRFYLGNLLSTESHLKTFSLPVLFSNVNEKNFDNILFFFNFDMKL